VVFLDRPKMRVERGSADDLFNFGATYGSIFPAIEMMMLAGVRSASARDDYDADQPGGGDQGDLGVPAEYQLIALIPMGYPDIAFQAALSQTGSSAPA